MNGPMTSVGIRCIGKAWPASHGLTVPHPTGVQLLISAAISSFQMQTVNHSQQKLSSCAMHATQLNGDGGLQLASLVLVRTATAGPHNLQDPD